MTLKVFDFEGQTAGTTATTTLTGANQVTANTGTIKYSARTVCNGVMGLEHTSGANALASARYLANATTSMSLSFGALIRVEATPASTYTTFMTIRNTGASPMRLAWLANGTVGIQVGTAAPSIILTGTFVPGTPYWVTVRATAATATTGQVTVNVYDASGSTLIGSGSSSTFNMGTTSLFGVDMGIINVDPTVGTKVSYDYIQLNDGSTTELFPPVTAYTGSVSLSGSGTLTESATFGVIGSTGLSGSGTLAQAGAPGFPVAIGFGGSGTLTEAGKPGFNNGLGLAGDGELDLAASNPTFTTGLSLSGSGTLTLGGSTPKTGTISLSGSGALSLQALVALAGVLQPSGSGTLGMAGTLGAKNNLPLTGSGTLGLAGVAHEAATGVLSLGGNGTLVFATNVGTNGQLDLVSEGVLDLDGMLVALGTLDLSGTGTLTLVQFHTGRDITITAHIEERRWHGELEAAERYTAHLLENRWTGRIHD